MPIFTHEHIGEAKALHRVIGLCDRIDAVDDGGTVRKKVDRLFGRLHRERFFSNRRQFRRPVYEFAIGGDVCELRLCAQDRRDRGAIAGNDGR